jgi:hypothetical protein
MNRILTTMTMKTMNGGAPDEFGPLGICFFFWFTKIPQVQH